MKKEKNEKSKKKINWKKKKKKRGTMESPARNMEKRR